MKDSAYVHEEAARYSDGKSLSEKLRQQGPLALRDAELLSLLLGIPVKEGDDLLGTIGWTRLKEMLADRPGCTLTPRRADVLAAAIELGERLATSPKRDTRPVIAGPADILPLLVDIRAPAKEHFMILLLDARNHLIYKEIISIGTLSASIVHPREVYSLALEHLAASLILAHNHPSGDVSPSGDDIELTKRLHRAGEIMGVEVLDHIIISQTDYLSMKEKGLM